MHLELPAAGISANTGLMLVLHNWGGRYNEPHYVAWCRRFADRYNVIAASINYLQSGGAEPVIPGEKPYDHGYLQALDCLRALYHIRRQLLDAGVEFNPRRCYSMGGSGGGNVSLMVNKFAPHTSPAWSISAACPLTDGIDGTGNAAAERRLLARPQQPGLPLPARQELLTPVTRATYVYTRRIRRTR